MRGALMIAGTASDVGKSQVVTGLCRSLRRRGVSVAPFKAQNMSLNSAVTADGGEIGRAQAVQAFAAGIEPDVSMNPVLLKPSGEKTCQVVVLGHPVRQMNAFEYHEHKPDLLPTVLSSLASLRARFDVVLLEGAGGAAEINLLDRDIVNLPLAVAAGVKSVVVGDIDRGGVFAALHGTHALLPAEQRSTIGGFIINKLRGDAALLLDGTARLEQATGVPTLGVLPHIHGLSLDAEDSLALDGPPPRADGCTPTTLDIAVVRWPHVANATDVDPLSIEPGVGVRWVTHAAALGRPDLIVLPGTKATIADLGWLRTTGLDTAIRGSGAMVLGICGGYQMLGTRIEDPTGAEAPRGTCAIGLGLLDLTTVFAADKVVRRRAGAGLGTAVSGYEIHHGRSALAGEGIPWLRLDGEDEGAIARGGHVLGTNLHGLFESDGFRHAFLAELAAARGIRWQRSTVTFASARNAQVDRLADLVEGHVDLTAIERLIEAAR
jgi:adenosylcobyric acid synthase